MGSPLLPAQTLLPFCLIVTDERLVPVAVNPVNRPVGGAVGIAQVAVSRRTDPHRARGPSSRPSRPMARI